MIYGDLIHRGLLLLLSLQLVLQGSLSRATSVAMDFYIARAGVPIRRVLCSAGREGVVSVFGINLYVSDQSEGRLEASVSWGRHQVNVNVNSLRHVTFMTAHGDVKPDSASSFLAVYLHGPDNNLTARCQFISSQEGTINSSSITSLHDMTLLTCCVASHCRPHLVSRSAQSDVSRSLTSDGDVCKTEASDVLHTEVRRQEGDRELLLTPTSGNSTDWNLSNNHFNVTLLYKRNMTSEGASVHIYVPSWQGNGQPDYTCNVHSKTQALCRVALRRSEGPTTDRASQNEGDAQPLETILAGVVSVLLSLAVCAGLIYLIYRRRRSRQQDRDTRDQDTAVPLRDEGGAS